jgi:hypothetical protein
MRSAHLVTLCGVLSLLLVCSVLAAPLRHSHHRVRSHDERAPAPQADGPLGPGVFGFDISVGLNTTTFECLVSHGYSFMVQRLWRSLCQLDAAAVASIDAAWEGGIQGVDVYLYPNRDCGEQTPESMVTDALQAMENHKFNMLWLDIELNHSNWSRTDLGSNVAWVERAAKQAIKEIGVERVGIYTSPAMWSHNRRTTERQWEEEQLLACADCAA